MLPLFHSTRLFTRPDHPHNGQMVTLLCFCSYGFGWPWARAKGWLVRTQDESQFYCADEALSDPRPLPL